MRATTAKTDFTRNSANINVCCCQESGKPTGGDGVRRSKENRDFAQGDLGGRETGYFLLT